MKQPVLLAACLVLLALGTPSLQAETKNAYPMLMSLRPAAAQVGQTTEHEVSARYNLHGASRIIVSGDGVIGTVVPAEDNPGDKPADPKAGKRVQSKLKVQFTVAATAVPGVRDFRIVTPQGVSTIGQLVIARDPIVIEAPNNNTLQTAQPITLPATVCGLIEANEDIDCFKFPVEAGAALTFHVRSQRLQNRIHDLQAHSDPIITLKNSAGSTLATSDNVYAGDPLLFHKFEQAGEYYLEIRDVRYKGNPEWTYSIEINARPFVTQVFPLGVQPGTDTKLSLVGYNLPAEPFAALTLPADAPAGVTEVSPLVADQPANNMAIYATSGPAAVEDDAPHNTQAAAQAITLPLSVSGRIAAEGEIDYYTFEAKAGETWSFNVIARRANSALDSIIRVLNEKGAPLVENDDTRISRINIADSWIEHWTVPADGKYTVEIRDLHLRGGAEFPYLLEITRSQPHFILETDTDKTLLAPGINAPLYVRVTRKNGFAGEVQLAIEGLPPGVEATAGKILADKNDGCILLQASADAPAGAANVRITGTATHTLKDGATLELAAVAAPLQEMYMPGGGRAHYAVDMHTVSVADPMDLRSVKISTSEITLKPGDSQKIEITIERAPDCKENVSLDIVYQHLGAQFGDSLPKGITIDGAQSKTLLNGTETAGYITLKVAGDAKPVERQMFPIMAHVSVNFVMKMTYASQPVFLTILSKEDAPAAAK